MNLLSPLLSNPLVETLEPRIAPAALVAVGADYDDLKNQIVFTPIADLPAFDPVRDFFAGSEDHYVVVIKAGDFLSIDHDNSAATPALPWISVKSGVAYAFFKDIGADGVSKDDLVGISLGGKATVTVNGTVNGSILTNVDLVGKNATFLGSELAPGAKNHIAGLTVSDDVYGSILSAGDISKVVIGGSISGSVLAGSATSGYAFDLAWNTGGEVDPLSLLPGQGVLNNFDPTTGQRGANITGLRIAGSVDSVQAGDGGAGSPGGSLQSIQVLANEGSLHLIAGAGGDGNLLKSTGGAGGKISGVEVHSGGGIVLDGDQIFVVAGNGGDGFFTSPTKLGNGGIGGSVDKLIIGSFYDAPKKSWVPDAYDFLVEQEVSVMAGNGGEGKQGGRGGDLLNNVIFAKETSLIYKAGDGGNVNFDLAGVKGGNGGLIKGLHAIVLTDDINAPTEVKITSGGGGDGQTRGSGGHGGSITNLFGLAALDISLSSGAGGSGAVGGNGGLIAIVNANKQFSAIQNVSITSGAGGDGGLKAGGHGGSITGVYVDNLNYLNHFTGQDQAPAGASHLYISGGPGNFNSNSPTRSIEVEAGWFDGVDWLESLQGNLAVNAPTYGDIQFSGRVEGNFSVNNTVYGRLIFTEWSSIGGNLNIIGNVDFGIYVRVWDWDDGAWQLVPYNPLDFPDIVEGVVNIVPQEIRTLEGWQESRFNLSVNTGKGGDGWTAGGNGGSIAKSDFSTQTGLSSNDPLDEVSWVLNAGDGGSGQAALAKGGNGGSFSNVILWGIVNGEIEELQVRAGNGGAGNAIGGNGGAINAVLGTVLVKEGFLQAGNGGEGVAASSKGGHGGSILNTSLDFNGSYAPVYIVAGTGGDGGLFGGAGGSIGKGYFTAGEELLLKGGHGGNGGTAHGIGGSILKTNIEAVSIDVTAGDGFTGGSVQSIDVLPGIGSYINSTVRISAGNGMGVINGVTGVMKPANGGAVSDALFVLGRSEVWKFMDNVSDPISIHIRAGDGDMGGNGGNIENIRDKILFDWQPDTLLPSILTDLKLTAGQGSDGQSVGGTGGSIKNVAFIAPRSDGNFLFEAGNGGSGNQGGRGGSVDGVTILSTTTAFQWHKPRWGWAFSNTPIPTYLVGFDTSSSPDLGLVEITTGNGGNSATAAIGGGAGDANNITWNTPWNINALARILNPGIPGMGTVIPGPEAKITNVFPNPLL
jgi:hypothetical protein